MKQILGVYNAPGPHWVGDGFPVRSLFSYNSHGGYLSPSLLLDYAGPASFTPTTDQRGDDHPGYQTLLRQDIPVVDLTQGAGTLRVIAGEYGGRTGPAHTFSPMDVWDLRLQQGRSTSLAFKAERTAALVVLRGTVQVNGSEIVREAQLVMLDRNAGEVALEANSDAALLVLSGEPLNEPIVGYGPFVMNTQEEIGQAIADFKSGKFGHMQ
jgi:redox-sensitive bicupin YhaK (pirin superfamily)